MEAGAFHGRLSDVRWDHVAVSAELPPADGAGPHAEGLTSGSVAHVSGPMLAGAARLGFHPAETHTHPARPCWPGAGVLETAGELRIEGEAGKSRESFGAALVARIAAQQGEEEERKEKRKKKEKEEGKERKGNGRRAARQTQAPAAAAILERCWKLPLPAGRGRIPDQFWECFFAECKRRWTWSGLLGQQELFQHCSPGCKPFDSISATIVKPRSGQGWTRDLRECLMLAGKPPYTFQARQGSMVLRTQRGAQNNIFSP